MICEAVDFVFSEDQGFGYRVSGKPRVPPGEARTFLNELFPLKPLTFKRLTTKGNSLKFDIRVSGVR